MRTLKIVCGIAVIVTTLHFAHGIHHFLRHEPTAGALMWGMAGAAVVVGIFSFIGGCLLFRRS